MLLSRTVEKCREIEGIGGNTTICSQSCSWIKKKIREKKIGKMENQVKGATGRATDVMTFRKGQQQQQLDDKFFPLGVWRKASCCTPRALFSV